MSGTTIAVFGLTIAGYATGWWTRGAAGRPSTPPAADALPEDARSALERGLAACQTALDSPAATPQLRDAMSAAESVDVALELRLGASDPRYRRFERMLNVLESVAHQAAGPVRETPRLQDLRAALEGVAAELDAP